MTITILIIGWLACAICAGILHTREQERIGASIGLIILFTGPFMLFSTILTEALWKLNKITIWRRKPADKAREE